MNHKKPNVTIQDVARAAGVSVSTVSRVLNDKDDVAPETYQKVQHTIAALGYTSSLAARSLRSRKTGVIGLIALDLDDPFVVEVLLGVNQAIQTFGYDLVLYASGSKGEGSRAVWEQSHVSLLNGSIVDGVIIVTPTAVAFPTAHPLVAVDPHSQDTDYPAVIATNRAGALEAMGYLTGLGHRRIGFVGGRRELRSAIQRLEGYREGLQKAGIPIDPQLIRPGDYSRQMGFSRAKELLSLPNPPTAIFAANDRSAIGVMEAAREMGVPIPQGLSVVGFDNIPETSYTAPPLTTIEQPMKKIGYIATGMLVNLIQGKDVEAQVHEVDTRLIIRDSCGGAE
jgi:LacI family transcriptional regulator